jgi:hypothetical protein
MHKIEYTVVCEIARGGKAIEFVTMWKTEAAALRCTSDNVGAT